MKIGVFSVYDSKAEVYEIPQFVQNSATAVRAVSDLLANPRESLARHPEDYSLFQLGEFDIREGKFELLPSPRLVVNLWELPKSAESGVKAVPNA